MNDALKAFKQQFLELEKQAKRPIECMAVTKYARLEQIEAAYNAGFTLFGENKVQDALEKQAALSHLNATWHFIGHLQTNKVRKTLGHFACIQSLDRIDLLEKLQQLGEAENTPISTLIQLNMGNEPNKFGFRLDSLDLNLPILFSKSFVRIKGVMVVAPFYENPEQCRPLFKKAKQTYDRLSTQFEGLSILSMGMSHDYRIAIEEGATQVRVGSLLFSS